MEANRSLLRAWKRARLKKGFLNTKLYNAVSDMISWSDFRLLPQCCIPHLNIRITHTDQKVFKATGHAA